MSDRDINNIHTSPLLTPTQVENAPDVEDALDVGETQQPEGAESTQNSSANVSDQRVDVIIADLSPILTLTENNIKQPSKTGVSGWFKEREPTPRSLPRARKRIFDCAIDISIVVLCCLLLVIASLGSRAHGNVMGDYEKKLLNAARIATTAFPYIFALTIGRSLSSLTTWRLENGINVLTFAYLSRSTTLANAYLTPVQLRSLHWLPLTLCFFWAFSPLGSQAMLRFISAQPRIHHLNSTVSYLYPNAWSWVGDISSCYNDGSRVGSTMASNALLLASFLISDNVTASSQDGWGHMKIPVFKESSEQPDSDGWVDLGPDDHGDYHSLIGIPFAVSSSLNQTFTIETWYWQLSSLNLTRFGQPSSPSLDSGTTYSLTNYTTIPGYAHFVGQSRVWQFAVDRSEKHMKSGARPFVFEQANDELSLNLHNTTHLEALIIPIMVELKIECVSTICQPTHMRNSTSSHAWSLENDCLLQDWFLGELALAIPYQHDLGDPSILEDYLRDPSHRAILYGALNSDLYDAGAEALGFRLSQIINTYWMAISFPTEISRSSSINDKYSTTYLNATTTLYQPESYLHCDKRWLALLCLASTIILCATMASGFIGFQIISPDPSDYLSAFTRAHQPPRVEKGSYLDADERVRLFKDVDLQIGDMDPKEEVGNIVLGLVGSVERLRVGRLYR